MNNKDSYWFKHDSTAGRGLKMRKMAYIYGHWGKGVYWDVIEILRDQEKYCFEKDESSLQLLADLIGCRHETRFITWFNDCLRIGLFQVKGSVFFCPPLTENMKVWETKKTNGKKGGRPHKKNLIKTETKTELKANKKHKIIEDNIIEDVYRQFLELVSKGEYDSRIEALYINNKLEKGSISSLVDEFYNHIVSIDKKHETPEEFFKHFINWLIKQNDNGRLSKYQKITKGSL